MVDHNDLPDSSRELHNSQEHTDISREEYVLYKHIEILQNKIEIKEAHAKFISKYLITLDTKQIRTISTIDYESDSGMKPPSDYFYRICLPEPAASDFFDNLEIVYMQRWAPKYGVKRAKLLWTRNAFGMVVRYWFDTTVAAAQNLRKIIWG